jgi:hypothetical protein
MNDKEKKEGTLPVISASTTNKSVTVIKGVGAKQARSQFSFDNVFTSFSNQQDVFSATLQPVITDVLQGFETCVFAYGQVRSLLFSSCCFRVYSTGTVSTGSTADSSATFELPTWSSSIRMLSSSSINQ